MSKRFLIYLTFFLCIFGLSFFSSLLNVETSTLENNAPVSKQFSLKNRLTKNQSTCDFVYYDKYGFEKFYNFSDFDFIENLPCSSYTPSQQTRMVSQYDKYYSLPYSAVCTVKTSYDTNNDGDADVTYLGTGVLVGPNVVLTAEENTYHSTYGYPVDMVFVPGEYKNDLNVIVQPFGSYSFLSIIRGNYHSTFDANDNWAIIWLDNNSIGYSTGWLAVSDTGVSNGSNVTVIGYNGSSSYQAVTYNSVVSNLQTYKFYHSSILPSMSNGAPVLNTSLNEIYGIQCSTHAYYNNSYVSQACKISIYLENWVQQYGGVLEVNIYSLESSSKSDPGHAWLTIMNNSPTSIIVGKYNLDAHLGITIGTWNGVNHSGLFYNLEYHGWLFNLTPFIGRVSYSRNVFIGQWNSINQYVIDGDSWAFWNNCSSFATRIWNYLLPNYQISSQLIQTPDYLASQIRSFSGYVTNNNLCGVNDSGYFDGNVFHNCTLA